MTRRFLDFSGSGPIEHPLPEQENFTQPQNDQGRMIKDRNDLDKGVGRNTPSDFTSRQNYIPPRGVPR